MATETLNIKIEALTKDAIKSIQGFSKDVNKSLSNINKNTEGATKGINRIGGTLGGISSAAKIAGAALVTAFAGRALISGIQSLVDEATQFENALIGVRSVAANFGVTADEVTTAVQDLASDGLVPVQDVANSLKNLLATGLDLDQSIELFGVLKDSAAFGRQGFLDLGQAIEGATQGIKNGQSTLVDNAGITKNLSVLQKEYATSIGTTVGKLTEVQKKQAVYTGILREGSLFAGDAARLTETYSGATSKLGFAISQTQVALGQFITQSPAIAKIVSLIAEEIKSFTSFVEENRESISKGLKENTVEFLRFSSTLFEILDKIKNGFEFAFQVIRGSINALFIAVAKTINFVIAGINKIRAIAGKDPLEGFTTSLEVATEALDDTFASFEKVGEGTSFLELASTKAGELAGQVSRIKANQSIDRLNKQVKQIAPNANAAGEGVKVLTKESAQFLERIGSRFSTVSASISQSLGQIGQSASSAFDFAFGTGADKQKKEIQQLQKDLQKAFEAGDISEQELNLRLGDTRQLEKELARNTSIGIGTGILNSFGKGASGAKDLVAGLGGLALDTIVPGLGQALGPTLDLLTGTEEEVKQNINAFAEQLPIIVEQIILNIPVLFEAIADKSDVIIERLAENSDKIIIALVRAAPRVAAKIAESVAFEVPLALAKSLPQALINIFKDIGKGLADIVLKPIRDGIKSVAAPLIDAGNFLFNSIKNAGRDFVAGIIGGAEQFIKKLVDSIAGGGGILGSVGGGILGGTVGGVVGSIGGSLGFAQGGQAFVGKVPTGFPNDTFPARLTSGELVVDRNTAFELKEFLMRERNPTTDGDDSSITNSLLAQLVGLMSGGQTVNTTVTLNEDAFADIILNLNRSNQRLA